MAARSTKRVALLPDISNSTKARSRRCAVLAVERSHLGMHAKGDRAFRILVSSMRHAEAGAAPLQWDEQAATKAQAWAERMAAANTMSHSEVTDGMGTEWNHLGETLGMASQSVWSMGTS